MTTPLLPHPLTVMLAATLALHGAAAFSGGQAAPGSAQSGATSATTAPAQAARAAAAPEPRTAANQPIALAETLLFQTRHLGNVHAPATLVYAFHKEGSLEAGFDDQVRLVFDASRAATLQFLSGARKRPMPELADPEGNPVLLGFLERDIAEMHRLTGGSISYFRKRIRLALADAAQVRPRRFKFGGKAVDGREVSIEPYLNDPMHARFEPFIGKRYVFLISAQVPGSIYQVRALVPGTAAAKRPPGVSDSMPNAAGTQAAGAARKRPLVDETLTLVGVEENRN
jgi:hypothetical protein